VAGLPRLAGQLRDARLPIGRSTDGTALSVVRAQTPPAVRPGRAPSASPRRLDGVSSLYEERPEVIITPRRRGAQDGPKTEG